MHAQLVDRHLRDDAREYFVVEPAKGIEHVADQIGLRVERDARLLVAHELADLIVAADDAGHDERIVLAGAPGAIGPALCEATLVEGVARLHARPVGFGRNREVERQRDRRLSFGQLHPPAHRVADEAVLVVVLEHFLRERGPVPVRDVHGGTPDIVEAEGGQGDFLLARPLRAPLVLEAHERPEELDEHGAIDLPAGHVVQVLVT